MYGEASYTDENQDFGWSGYPDERDSMAGFGQMVKSLNKIGRLQRMGEYERPANVHNYADNPDTSMLAPVPYGFAGRNPPALVQQDAQALLLLGYLGTEDVPFMTDATDPVFRTAIYNFQVDQGITADGLTGPQTRATLARAVSSYQPPDEPAPPSPSALPDPVAPPAIEPYEPPAEPGGMSPVVYEAEDNTKKYVVYGAAALLLLGVGYFALK